jgi:hypothetical protein
MMPRAALFSLFVLSSVSLFCCAPVVHGEGPKKGEEQAATFSQLSKLLAKRVTLEGGDVSFKDALQHLSDRHEVTILIDTQAFKNETGSNIEDQLVRLPRMVNVRLSTVLRLLLEQVHATYLVRSDYIEVTSLERSRPERWHEYEVRRPMLPLVNADLDRQPLDEALEELSNASDISIIIDKRVTKDARTTSVTATLKNVPLDTAVRLLADGAGLGAVLVDNVLYVTSKGNAEIVHAGDLKRRTNLAETR